MAFVLIPQSLAYAELAGLPPYYGLYAAMLPPIAAAFFASSRHLQTGPVAMTSLLTFGALVPLAAVEGGEFIALAALLALVVGAARIAVGALRVGWIAYLMSQPVLAGFTAAAAILITASQLPTALGVTAPAGSLLGRAWWALTHVAAWDVAAVVLAAVTVVLVMFGRRIHPVFPGVLVAVGIGLVYSVVAGYAGPVVGPVPSGLPPFTVELPWERLPTLLLPGIVIALVGFGEAAAISRTFAAEDRFPWNPDREFVSQGVANVAAALSSAFPVGGSFSRSSINRLAGGRTRWSGAVAGVVVLAFLPAAGVLAPLPRAVLGAIVIAAVVKLIQPLPMVRMLRTSVLQGGIAWATFGLTLALAPRIDRAVLIGIVLALLVHAWRELSILVEARYADGALTLTPKGVLFFASAPGLDQALLKQLAAHPEATSLIIDLQHLGRIDYTGAMALKAFMASARHAGLTAEFTGTPPHSKRIMGRVFGTDL